MTLGTAGRKGDESVSLRPVWVSQTICGDVLQVEKGQTMNGDIGVGPGGPPPTGAGKAKGEAIFPEVNELRSKKRELV